MFVLESVGHLYIPILNLVSLTIEQGIKTRVNRVGIECAWVASWI
jgi:hypothetical protein